MGKRGNEGQISKEDYDEVSESSNSSEAAAPFSRASVDEMSARRTVRAVRQSPMPEETGVADSAKKNPFAKINLTQASSSPTAAPPSFSFGAKATSPAAAPVPAFSFGTGAAPSASPKAASASGFASGAGAAPAASSSSFVFPTAASAKPSASSSSSSSSGNNKAAVPKGGKDAATANRTFQKIMQGLKPNVANAALATTKYMRYGIRQLDIINQDFIQGRGKGDVSGTSPPAAPSAAAPSFGNFANAGTASSAKASFSFGGGSPTAAAPTPDTTEGGTDTAPVASATDDADGIRETTDPNWNDVAAFDGVKAYHSKDPTEKTSTQFVCFATGKFRIQCSKMGSDHRMLMRDKTGIRVLLNMILSSDMNLVRKAAGRRKCVEYGEVTFNGTNDKDRGYEIIRVLAPADTILNLHTKMEEVA